MKFGLDVATSGDFADTHRLAGLAAEAEQAGWDGFFVWDVIFAHQTHGPGAGGRPVPGVRGRRGDVVREAFAGHD